MARPSASRREFIRIATACTAGLGAAEWASRSTFAEDSSGSIAPNERLGIGVIGTGGMGSGHLGWLIEQADLEVLAVCDVDQGHLANAVETVTQRHGKGSCQGFADFRQLLAKPEIDAVWVTTPDHWHALVSIAAIEAGKDVYCEKPLTNSVGEGIALRNAVKRSDRILQCGSHERSNNDVRFACELVRNGRLGKIHTIRINLPCVEDHHNQARERSGKLKRVSPPSELNYDMWLGHTPEIPYAENRCHFWWRFNTQFGGGEMTDRGAHVIDIAQLALGMDHSGPIEFRAKGTPLPGELYNACLDFEFENTYANGIRIIGQSSGTRGLKIEGEKGSIFIHIHGGKLEAEPSSLLNEVIGDKEIHLGRTPDHKRNFLDAVRARDPNAPFAHVEVGHRTATICHLNNLAMRLGRTLKWDPESEKIVGDNEAQSLLMPKMRQPWSIKT
jgi:predicted dehydrogenase